MKKYTLLYVWLTAAGLFCLLPPLPVLAGSEFIAIAYHDVVDSRSELTYDAITIDNLIDHFEWLKAEGYQPVSIDDLKAARAGTRPLPDKAVLLCWDDAYTSFYTCVLPLLRAYNYPAVLAIVGNWMSPGPDEMVQYGDKLIPRKKFMTWRQVKEAAASGLVEIANHSDNLHTTVLADQAGDRLPAATAHRYDPVTSTYETEQQFRQRLRGDLQAGSDLILQHLGFRPRVLVWPFGRYNAAALKIAAETGMAITLTLNPVPADTDHLEAVGRIYPTRNPDLRIFRSYLESQLFPPVQRFFRINSHDLLEPSTAQEKNFGTFLDRVKDLDPNMVILDPVVKENGIHKALFTNSRFPVVQDRLNRLCWHTSKRAGADVFLWLSSSLFTPSAGETEDTINRFFSDMGKSAPGGGLVINDPHLVSELLKPDEYSSNIKETLRFWNPEKRRQARQIRSRSAADLRVSMSFRALEAFQQWQPFQEVGLVLPRDQFATMELLQFKTLLSFFDFLILDTGQENVRSLAKTIAPQLALLKDAGYLRKCVVMLSTENRDNTLASELKQLPPLDIINWGYQFDRFLAGSPSPDAIRPLLSKRSFPFPLRP